MAKDLGKGDTMMPYCRLSMMESGAMIVNREREPFSIYLERYHQEISELIKWKAS